MRISFEKTSITAIILTLCVLSALAGTNAVAQTTSPAPATLTAEQALEQKLGGVVPAKQVELKKIAAPKKVKSALQIDCGTAYTEAKDKLRCAQAQRNEIKKVELINQAILLDAEPDSIKDLREQEARDAEKAKKAHKEAWRITQFANISGCQPGTVGVSPKAVPPGWRMKYGVVVELDVTNAGDLPIDEIRVGARTGTVIQNLCTKGIVSIAFAMDEYDGQQREVVLRAYARYDGGIKAVEKSVTLNRWNSDYNRVQTINWTVELNAPKVEPPPPTKEPSELKVK